MDYESLTSEVDMNEEIILENQLAIMKVLNDLLIDSRDVYDEVKELKTRINRTNEVLEEFKTRKRIAESMLSMMK